MDCSPPGSSVHGIEPRSPTLQVGSLPSEPPGKPSVNVQWIELIAYVSKSVLRVIWKLSAWWSESESCSVLSNSLQPHGLYSPGQNTGVGSLSLLQGMFPTQGLNPGLLHCRRILNQLSHKGSPRILEWVAYPFFGGSSWPRNQTRVSCIAGGFFTNWAIREAPWWSGVRSKLD